MQPPVLKGEIKKREGRGAICRLLGTVQSCFESNKNYWIYTGAMLNPLPSKISPGVLDCWTCRCIHVTVIKPSATSLSYTLCICPSPCSGGTCRASDPTLLNI